MYNLAIVQNEETRTLYGYENLSDALALFHQELAYRGDTRTSTFCLIFDEYGQIFANERWTKPVEDESSESDGESSEEE